LDTKDVIEYYSIIKYETKYSNMVTKIFNTRG